MTDAQTKSEEPITLLLAKRPKAFTLGLGALQLGCLAAIAGALVLSFFVHGLDLKSFETFFLWAWIMLFATDVAFGFVIAAISFRITAEAVIQYEQMKNVQELVAEASMILHTELNGEPQGKPN